MHPDIVLTQPLTAPVRGMAAAREEFRRIWRLLPDLRVQVDRWRGDSEMVFIELRPRAHVTRDLIEWPAIDRIVLRDGKAIERMTYFDPLPLLPAILKHPSLWRRWCISGAARPWRTGHRIADYTGQANATEN
ncbi:nuclear transport factor 2 family protein [Amycolatopsis regifaucium]|uniref:nuclear transport factor 2 family protein n=1 Tax=Amycolatopsis regifaucium TaxID=546365 RepID=UPI0007C84288|nr:nuclear transport factor 2 family protein [Amycolatopsis regifaucium]